MSSQQSRLLRVSELGWASEALGPENGRRTYHYTMSSMVTTIVTLTRKRLVSSFVSHDVESNRMLTMGCVAVDQDIEVKSVQVKKCDKHALMP